MQLTRLLCSTPMDVNVARCLHVLSALTLQSISVGSSQKDTLVCSRPESSVHGSPILHVCKYPLSSTFLSRPSVLQVASPGNSVDGEAVA